MEYFDSTIENKRDTAKKYREFFDSINIPFFTEPEHCRSNYWLNVMFLRDREKRDAFLQYSNSNGVQTRPVWQLIPTLPPYASCQCGPIPIAKDLEDRIVNIPSSVRIC
jgi:dTDP-4-amino-4,6-dideoxygalactose transaminase